MAALVIAEHDNASPQGRDPEHRHRGHACGGDVHVLVAGHNAGAAAQAAAQIAGVAKVLHADAAGLATAWPRTSPRRCWPSPRNYSHILFPATASGKNVRPRVAALLDVAQISDAPR
jgi:electron transfer flavoprotein alpha subunit